LLGAVVGTVIYNARPGSDYNLFSPSHVTFTVMLVGFISVGAAIVVGIRGGVRMAAPFVAVAAVTLPTGLYGHTKLAVGRESGPVNSWGEVTP